MDRQWLNVPYREKNAAKSLGAFWDSDNRRWYAPNERVYERTSRWHPAAVKETKNPETKAAVKETKNPETKAAVKETKRLELSPEEKLKKAWQEFESRPPRTPKQCLYDLNVIPKKASGFCRMCDSRVVDSWIFGDCYDLYHLLSWQNHHTAPSKSFLQSAELKMLEEALDGGQLDEDLRIIQRQKGSAGLAYSIGKWVAKKFRGLKGQ